MTTLYSIFFRGTLKIISSCVFWFTSILTSSPLDSNRFMILTAAGESEISCFVLFTSYSSRVKPRYAFGCGDKICTYDLLVMSQTSYYCSTPRYAPVGVNHGLFNCAARCFSPMLHYVAHMPRAGNERKNTMPNGAESWY